MTRYYSELGSVSDWLEFSFSQSEALPRSYNLGSDASSVWNFCARYSDVVLRGLMWRPRETSAAFSGYPKSNSRCIETPGLLVYFIYFILLASPYKKTKRRTRKISYKINTINKAKHRTRINTAGYP